MVHCVQSRTACTVYSVLRLIAVQNILCCPACSVHNGPPSLKYQYSLSIFSSLGLSSLYICPPLILILKVLEVVDEAGEDSLDLPDFVGQLGQVVHKQELPLQTPTPCHSRQQQI